MTNKSINAEKFENYVSQVEAARIVGVSKQALSKMVHRGYFNTLKVAGQTLILRSEAESLAEQPKGRRRQVLPEKQRASKPPKKALADASEEYVTRAEAARIRGVSQPAIADLIRRGRLTPIGVADRILLLRSEVESFVPQPIGRPSKKRSSKLGTLRLRSNAEGANVRRRLRIGR